MSKAQLKNSNFLHFHRFYEGDEPADDFDLNKALANPKAKSAIEEWAERSIAKGLKEKNSQIFDKLTKYKVMVKNEKGEEVESYLDPEKAKAALTFMETEGKDFEEKLNKAVTEANNRSNVRIKTLENELDQTKNGYVSERRARYAEKIGYELRDTLRSAGIKDGKLPLHERYLQEFVTVEVDTNGKETIVVKDADGNLRYGKSGPMTLQEFVFEYRDSDDISDDFMAMNPGGSGGSSGSPFKGVTQGAIDAKLPPQERMKLFRQQQAAMRSRR